MNNPIYSRLNPAQLEAVTHREGPLMVIAGAGSGKTRVITHRIAYLVQECEVAPWQIFAATFTNKAAREMRERVYKILGPIGQARLSISTFHSLCAMLLRREAQKVGLTARFTILDDTDQKGIVRACMERLKIETKSLTPEQALDRIGAAKIRMLSPDDAWDLFAGGRQQEYYDIYKAYEAMLAENDALDFDDLLLRMVRLFESDAETLSHYQDRYRHLLVDEYQDTNAVQFRFIQLLAGQRMNLCVVGDEDQSIYSWRGAEIRNLLDFPEVFPNTKIVRLEENYRSTQTILDIANKVIKHNRDRHDKTLRSQGVRGVSGVLYAAPTSQSEARFVVQEILRLRHSEEIPFNEVGVFYRINALSRSVEDELRANDIPYRVVGGIRFYDRAEIKDVLAYLTVVANPFANLALSRIINRPRRGVGDKSLRALQIYAGRNGVSLYEAMRNLEALDQVSKKTAASLMELHALFDKWRQRVDKIPLASLVEMILDDTKYIESLGDEQSLEAVTRKENLNELIGAIEEYEKNAEAPSLYDYLEKVALTASADENEPDEPSVSLMTMHSAKGLEFRAVFIIGLEENLFPSPRAVDAYGSAEEERRLFYVGITRAKERVFFSWAKTRMMYGRQDWMTPSIFLHELPKEFCAAPDGVTGGVDDDAQAAGMGRMMPRPFRRPGRYQQPKKKAEPPRRNAYAVGQVVEHLFLGQGEIVGIEGEGDGKKLLVQFEDGEISEVLERYGDLKIVG